MSPLPSSRSLARKRIAIALFNYMFWRAAGAAGGVAAGIVRSLFAGRDNSPTPVYRNYVNRCLADQGYQPVGWN